MIVYIVSVHSVCSMCVFPQRRIQRQFSITILRCVTRQQTVCTTRRKTHIWKAWVLSHIAYMEKKFKYAWMTGSLARKLIIASTDETISTSLSLWPISDEAIREKLHTNSRVKHLDLLIKIKQLDWATEYGARLYLHGNAINC